MKHIFNGSHQFLETSDAEAHVPHFAQELDRAQQYIQHADRAQQYIQQEVDDYYDKTETTHRQDDWMHLCSLNTEYATSESTDSSYDWCEYARSLTSQTLREAPSWITSTRKNQPDTVFSHPVHAAVAVSTLNYEQNLAFKIILLHSQQLASNQHPPPLHMIVEQLAQGSLT